MRDVVLLLESTDKGAMRWRSVWRYLGLRLLLVRQCSFPYLRFASTETLHLFLAERLDCLSRTSTVPRRRDIALSSRDTGSEG
jgi:hypothetical protein